MGIRLLHAFPRRNNNRSRLKKLARCQLAARREPKDESGGPSKRKCPRDDVPARHPGDCAKIECAFPDSHAKVVNERARLLTLPAERGASAHFCVE